MSSPSFVIAFRAPALQCVRQPEPDPFTQPMVNQSLFFQELQMLLGNFVVHLQSFRHVRSGHLLIPGKKLHPHFRAKTSQTSS
jgi:hypothetical protein